VSEVNMVAPTRATTLPEDPAERKKYPLATGFFDYFPDAIVAVSRVSWQGNEQHNPGEPLHWARGKSMDQDDTLLRHFAERGTLDKDGQRHSAKLAWRALAILQLEIEAEQAASVNQCAEAPREREPVFVQMPRFSQTLTNVQYAAPPRRYCEACAKRGPHTLHIQYRVDRSKNYFCSQICRDDFYANSLNRDCDFGWDA
jgi:hypothetical protein